jgi:hypothetical protein
MHLEKVCPGLVRIQMQSTVLTVFLDTEQDVEALLGARPAAQAAVGVEMHGSEA